MSMGYIWNSIWHDIIAYIRAEYLTVLFRYSVTEENLWVSIAISENRLCHTQTRHPISWSKCA